MDPLAIMQAALKQRELTLQHKTRLQELLTDRYTPGSLAHASALLGVAIWTQIYDQLDAVCNGKTVQPS